VSLRFEELQELRADFGRRHFAGAADFGGTGYFTLRREGSRVKGEGRAADLDPRSGSRPPV
jgi:hypothetical protein